MWHVMSPIYPSLPSAGHHFPHLINLLANGGFMQMWSNLWSCTVLIYIAILSIDGWVAINISGFNHITTLILIMVMKFYLRCVAQYYISVLQTLDWLLHLWPLKSPDIDYDYTKYGHIHLVGFCSSCMELFLYILWVPFWY